MDTEFKRLADEAPEVAYSMLVLDMIMKQRGITQRTIANYMGVSNEAVSQTLRFSAVRSEGEPWRNNTRSIETQIEWIDMLDDALSMYCHENGMEVVVTNEMVFEWHETMERLMMDANSS